MKQFIPITIYTEQTPNPSAMKYVANIPLVEGDGIEFSSIKECGNSPFALWLFGFPFVKSVFIANNFITITKHDFSDWFEINLELREQIQQYLAAQKPIFSKAVFTKDNVQVEKISSVNPREVAYTETEIKIIETLDEYIKPAVENDGGMISFKSFVEGKVTVQLQGSCSGCPSSTITLKAGIETLLKRLIPEVEEVVALNE
jgi:NFU1 iron-sulfur cluster scaffold homolog, mitochondrial